MGAHHIADGDHGKAHAVGLSRTGVDAGGAGASLTAPQHVGADHKVAVRVDGKPGTDKPFPPPRFVPGKMRGAVRISREGMGDHHDVIPGRAQRAVGFIRQRKPGKRLAALQAKRPVVGEILHRRPPFQPAKGALEHHRRLLGHTPPLLRSQREQWSEVLHCSHAPRTPEAQGRRRPFHDASLTAFSSA